MVGVSTFLVYLFTLYPSLPGGDSGELINAAFSLGVAHPPGYPLYTLLGHIFTWIPIGNIAWRVNLLSAVCNSGAAVFLCLTVTRWSKRLLPTQSPNLAIGSGILAAGLFAFSPLAWRYSIQAEVFGLNNLLLSLSLYLAWLYLETRQIQLIYLGSLALGLGLSHHHTFLFWAVPLSVWVLWVGKSQLLCIRKMLKIIVFFLLGLTPYFYLPLAGRKISLSSWGDPSTWDGFWHHFLRKDYGTFQLGIDNRIESHFWGGIQAYLSDLPQETLYIGLILAVFGLWKAMSKEGRFGFAAFSLGAFCFYQVVFNQLANLNLESALLLEVQRRFWLMPNFLIYIWIGIGFSFLAARLGSKISLGTLSLVVTMQLALNFQNQNQRQNWLFYAFGRSILEFLPPQSLILIRGDIFTHSIRYLQECEGMRRDVRIVDLALMQTPWKARAVRAAYPELLFKSGDWNLRNVFDLNYGKMPIFITNLDPNEDQTWKENYDTWPFGFLNQVVKKGELFDFDLYFQQSQQQIPRNLESSLPFTPPRGSWERVVLGDYWDIDRRRANRIITFGILNHEDPKYFHLAELLLKTLIQRHPIPPPELYKNLGIVYSHLLKSDPQAHAGMVQAWTQFLALTGDQDNDAPTIKKALGR